MPDYRSLYSSCVLTSDPNKLEELDYIARTAIQAQPIYQQVANAAKIPWLIIAVIHYRESDQSFKCHLHNGDPLTARTIHVPAGRPVNGQAPFTWPESACDALKGIWRPSTWDLSHSLEFIERYNGLGYQHRGIATPYLWDYTNLYTSGLFISDGSFNATARENRPGAVPILKTLVAKGVSLEFSSLNPPKPLLH